MKENTVIDKDQISALKKNIYVLERHISGLRDAQDGLQRERSEADGIVLSLRRSLAETKEEVDTKESVRRSQDEAFEKERDRFKKGMKREGDEVKGLRREVSDLLLQLEVQTRQAKEKAAKGDEDIRRALAAQHDELQKGYLSLLLQQTSSAMGVIKGQHAGSRLTEGQGQKEGGQSLEAANDDFLDLMRTLPDAWSLKHGTPANTSVSIAHDLLNAQDAIGSNLMNKTSRARSHDQEDNTPCHCSHAASLNNCDCQKSRHHLYHLPQQQQPKSPIVSPLKYSLSPEQTAYSAMVNSYEAQPEVFDSLPNSSPDYPPMTLSPTSIADAPLIVKHIKTKAKVIYSLPPRDSEGKEIERSIAIAKLRAAQFNGRPPSLKSTPTEQLLAAISDGDIKGIKAVVKIKGVDLASRYWRDLSSSMLPLHRALNSLYHSGEILVAVAATLCDMRCDVNGCDAKGYSPLHKAITLCPESHVCLLVVNLLLSRGVNPSHKNKEGDTPLHLALLRVGADVICTDVTTSSSWSSKTQQTHPSVLPSEIDTIYHAEGGTLGVFGDKEGSRVFNWVFVAEKLLRSGAIWDPINNRHGCKDNELHLLLKAFPSTDPGTEETAAYQFLLCSALSSIDPSLEDFLGRNAIFVLCDRLANIPAVTHLGALPLHLSVMGIVLDALRSRGSGIGGSDRTGHTIFDIQESAHNSCLSAGKHLFLQATATSTATTTDTHINTMARCSISRNKSFDDVDHEKKHFHESYPSFINRSHSLDLQKRSRKSELIFFLN